MICFKDYIYERQEGSGLTIWDIDETLFNTKALIYVMKDGEVFRKLSNQEFNTYKLGAGESFDFREFRDAKHFRDTSEPIVRAINKLIAIHKNVKAKGSKMIVITARADFDDRDMFLDTFRKQGIDIDDIKRLTNKDTISEYINSNSDDENIIKKVEKQPIQYKWKTAKLEDCLSCGS